MRSAVPAALVAVGLLLSGCAAERAAESAPASRTSADQLPAVTGMAAEVIRYRTDEAAGGRVQVLLTDTGTAPFAVTAVTLDSPGFEQLPATPVSADFAPRQTIALPVPFGAVRCASSPQPAAARLTVVRPDGAVEDLRVPATGDTLARVHEQECAVASVREVLDVALEGLTPVPDGDRLLGAVLLSRRVPDATVEVTDLGSSVLLAPEPAEDLPVVLRRDAGELRMPVTFRVASCAPHVLAEAKKPFVFPLAVVVDDEEPVLVDLPVDQGQRDALLALVEDVCG
jgi:hypothetical protein